MVAVIGIREHALAYNGQIDFILSRNLGVHNGLIDLAFALGLNSVTGFQAPELICL